MTGAGGTEGGIGRFFGGLAMLLVGFYLLLSSVRVTSGFGLGHTLFGVGGVGVTGGMILIPMLIGVGMIFYDRRGIFGWILAVGSFLAMLAGIIASVRFRLWNVSAFDLIVMVVLIAGGAGILLSALRPLPSRR